MRHNLVASLLLVVPAAVPSAPGEEPHECRAMAKDLDGDGSAEVVLENRSVRLVFHPEEGGRAESFLREPDGFEVTSRGHGLFVDSDYGPAGASAERPGPYQSEVVRNDPKSSVVRLWGHGNTPEREFIEFSKTLLVRAGSGAIEAKYEIWNIPESEGPLTVRPWFQHGIRRTGNGDRWYLPGARGVQVVSPDTEAKSFWEYRPTAGWIAFVSEAGPGLAAVFDEQDLQCLCGWVDKGGVGTIEWRLRPLVVRHAECYEHHMVLIPFRGLPRVDGASRAMVGAFEFPERLSPGEVLPLNARLVAPATISGLQIALKYRGASDGLWHKLPDQKTDLVADQAARVQFGQIGIKEPATVCRLDAWDGPKRVFWMERPVISGEEMIDYELRDTPETAGDGNLLANGSFERELETGSREGVRNWFGAKASGGRDDSRVHSGNYSFHIRQGSAAGVGAHLAQLVQLDPGKYQLTGHSFRTEGGGGSIRVTFTGQQADPNTAAVLIPVAGEGNAWRSFGQAIRVPQGASGARIELVTEGHGEVWWDGLRLEVAGTMAQAADTKTDIPYRADVVTPHIRWAKPLPGGPLKALLLTDSLTGREIIELAQRVDVDFETVTTSPSPSLGEYSTCAIHRMKDWPLAKMRSKIEQKLKKPFEVIAIGAISGELFSEEAHELLTKSVERGAGLLWVMPIRLPEELRKTSDNLQGDPAESGDGLEWVPAPTFVERNRWSLLPFGGIQGFPENPGRWSSHSDHYIPRGIPLKHLPPTMYLGYKVSGTPIAEIGSETLIAVGQAGEGRTVCLNYQAIRTIGERSPQSWRHFRDKDLICGGFTPQSQDPRAFESVAFPYWEYQLGLVARCLLWAAKREPPVSLSNVTSTKPSYPLNEMPQAQVDLEAAAPGTVLELEIHTYAETLGLSEVKTEKITLTRPKDRVRIGLAGSRTPGRHFCDVILRDPAGNSLDWGTAVFHIETPVAIQEVQLSEEIWDIGKPIRARVLLNRAPTPGTTCRWAIEDEWGRRIDRQEAPATATMDLAADVSRTLTRRFRLTVDLLDRDVLLSRATKQGTCALQSEPWRDFQFVMSGALESRRYLQRATAKQFRAIGVTAIRGSESAEDFCRLQNFPLVGSSTGLEEHPEIQVRTIDDTEYPVRAVCLNDPATLKAMTGQASVVAEKLFINGGIAVGLGDESQLGGGSLREVCFSEHCLAELRKWLATQYADLDALNEEWESTFERWEDVRPMLSSEVLKDEFRKRNYAPWADHREFMDLTVARFHQRLLAAMRQENPGVRMGMSGTQKASVYFGIDWWLLSWAQNYVQAYTVEDQHEMRLSFRRPGVRGPPAALRDDPGTTEAMADASLPGYAWTGYAGIGRRVAQKPFYYLFHGLDSGYWKAQLAIDPDLTLSQSGADYAAACRPLLGGLGRLIKAYERTQDGIAIHYSQASLRVSTIEKWDRSFEKSRHAWVSAIESLGYQYHFVSYEQLERGELDIGEYRAFVLPRSVALSEKEILAVRSFVEGGGTVIADGQPGLFDGHCRSRDPRPLEALFGIASAQEAGSPANEIVLGEGLGAERLSIVPLDTALRADGGTALGKSGEVPVLFQRRTGQGQTFCLNYAPDAGGDSLRVIDALFQRAGVVRRIGIADVRGQHMMFAERFLYRAGANWIVGALLPGNAPPELIVELPREGYVHDLLERKSAGLTRRVSLPVREDRIVLLAQIPYEVQAIRMNLPQSVAAGQDVPLVAELDTTGAAGLHVFRLEVFGPGGDLLGHYCANLDAPAGKVNTKIRLAMNDKPGVWRIALRDVISGIDAEGTVEVQAESR